MNCSMYAEAIASEVLDTFYSEIMGEVSSIISTLLIIQARSQEHLPIIVLLDSAIIGNDRKFTLKKTTNVSLSLN